MFKEKTLNAFLADVSGSEPVPGGGTVSAVAGAIGSSLMAMVCNLTIGKKKYVEVEEEMKDIREKAEAFREKLLELADKDAESYGDVVACFSLPKETEEEKKHRSEMIQKNLYKAALTPLEIARTCLEALKYVKTVFDKGNKNAYSDAKVAAVMLRSGVFAAVYNVEINLESLTDESLIAPLKKEVEGIIEEAKQLEKEVIE
ncbi:cyclodeaminase/cyclohydrolase family protein [Guggenheimella bovis]